MNVLQNVTIPVIDKSTIHPEIFTSSIIKLDNSGLHCI